MGCFKPGGGRFLANVATPMAALPAAAAKDRVLLLSPPPPRPRIERARSWERSPPKRPALIVAKIEHITVDNAIDHA
jgi:hypothetical protein